MATRTLNLQLYGHQTDFVCTDATYAALVGGIGSGKSHAGAVRGLLAALGHIGTQTVPVPNLGQVTAPTYPMLRDATLRTYLEIAGDLVAVFNKSENTITLTNGSEILFRSTDSPDRLRGPNLAWWHGDEAALYTPDVWRIMIGRLRQFGQRGSAWLTFTPKGRNWVWQEFVRTERPDYAYWQMPTEQNPFVDEEFAAGLRDAYTGDFARQELYGEFVAFEGLIYPEFRRDVHVALPAPPYPQTIAGVDWGYAHPGVILVCGVDGDERMSVVDEHYQRQRRIEEWVSVAEQARATWNIRTFFCDPSEPDYIKAFRDAGLNAVQATNTVNPGLQAVKNRLVVQGDGRPRLTVTPGAVYTIAEFESYQWAENRYGVRDEPLKANDHAMDALRYLCMGLERRKPLDVQTSRWA